MTRRVAIELTSSRCTIVEVEGGRRRSRIRTVRSLSYAPGDPAGLVAALRHLLSSRTFSRRARVVMWGLRSGHQLMSLPPASPADLHDLALREARRTLPFIADGEVTSGIVAAPSGRNDVKRDVSFVAVSAPDVRSHLQPIVSGGFDVEAVVTPPLALAAVARVRGTLPEAVNAFVAVNRDAACLSIVHNGLILFAREMPGGDPTLDRNAFAARLGADLKRSFLFFAQTFKLDVGKVFLCGDFSGLRSLTAPLIRTLDVEVETLDSLGSLDRSQLPIGDQSEDGLGELQLSWATALDRTLPVNLLPQEGRQRQATWHFLRRLAVGSGLAVLLVALAWLAARAYGNSIASRAHALGQEIARLEPQVQAARQARVEQARGVARRAAIEAFATEGPRLARVLEGLGRSAPEGVFFMSISAVPNGAAWRVSVKARAAGRDPGAAEIAYNQFIRLATDSPYLGVPTRVSNMRVWSGDQTMMTAEEPMVARASPTEQGAANQPRVVPRADRSQPGLAETAPVPAPRIPASFLDVLVEFEVRK